MARIAREKYAGEPKVQVICGDVEEYAFDRKFDRIVVYNAFPHFPYPKRLIKILAGLLKEDGRLTVAHGMSRAQIDHRHEGPASKVSVGLMHEDALAEIFARHLTVTVKISDENMYQVTGRK
jgi:demethylmenaquinone methyltransferase/2-methoxy-6-polyprenyl-1,4-benzoquinol methylase